jgi:hypothetical protein
MECFDVTKRLISQSFDETLIHAQATCLKRANRHLISCNPVTDLFPITECSPANCVRFIFCGFKMRFFISMRGVTYITRQQKEKSAVNFKLNSYVVGLLYKCTVFLMTCITAIKYPVCT